MNHLDYQLVIIGGGPAGLTAGLYAARSRLKAVLLEKGVVGGQVLVTEWVENYPGFPAGISGSDLIDKMAAHAAKFALKTRSANVMGMDLAGPVKKLFLEGGEELRCQAVIIATGARPNKINVPGEAELTGKGVSYCATCDGPFFRDQEIAVIGGGDTAVQEAAHLTKFARKVSIIHRRDELRAIKVIQERAFANDKIHFIWNSVVTAIDGREAVDGIRLRAKDGRESALAVQGVFVLVGTRPNNECLPHDQLALDDWGFVRTDSETRTNIPGVMAAGDIRSKAVRQIVNAAGEGAVAVIAAENYLNTLA